MSGLRALARFKCLNNCFNFNLEFKEFYEAWDRSYKDFTESIFHCAIFSIILIG